MISSSGSNGDCVLTIATLTDLPTQRLLVGVDRFLRGHVTLARATLLGHLDHVPTQSHTGHSADYERGDVGLTPAEPVTGRGWKRMMVVVPGLAQRRQRQPQQVARMILSGVVA